MKLITKPTNLRYLTGFTGSSGFLLIFPSKAIFFTDFRYRAQAEALAKAKPRLPFEFVEMDRNFSHTLKKICARSKTVEFEASHLTLSAHEHWQKWLPGKTWKPLKQSIEKQRLIKDANEIKALKTSQKANEAVLTELKKYFKTGVTEAELAWKIRQIGHDQGLAEGCSFDPIVAFGPHSAIPHHHPTEQKLKANDTILIDMGMLYQGYCSDMSRTFFHGKASAEQENIYKRVLEAQEAAIKACKAGVKASTLSKTARKTMGEHEEHFKHALGHGIGLEVHEGPAVSSRSRDTLKAGMVITVEPGIYLEGRFGVRIEDMGQVTPKGYENFTKMQK